MEGGLDVELFEELVGKLPARDFVLIALRAAAAELEGLLDWKRRVRWLVGRRFVVDAVGGGGVEVAGGALGGGALEAASVGALVVGVVGEAGGLRGCGFAARWVVGEAGEMVGWFVAAVFVGGVGETIAPAFCLFV